MGVTVKSARASSLERGKSKICWLTTLTISFNAGKAREPRGKVLSIIEQISTQQDNNKTDFFKKQTK